MVQPDVLAVFKLMQATHLSENIPPDPVGNWEPKIFTALPMLKYLEDECSTDNSNLVKRSTDTIEQMYRRNGSNPLQWLNEFPLVIATLVQLQGVPVANPYELWQETFSRNLNQ